MTSDPVESRSREHITHLIEGCDRAILLATALMGVVLPISFGPWDDAFGYPKTLLVVVGAIFTLVVLAIRLASGGLAGADLLKIDMVAGTLFVLVWVSWFLSVDRNQSLFGERFLWQGAMATIVYATFYVAVRISVTSYDRMIQLLGAVVLGGSLVALFAWVQWFGWDPLWTEPRDRRVFSTVGQPNALAAYLVMVFSLGLALSRQPFRLFRILGGVAVVLSAGAVGATLSRGGVLGLGAAAFVFSLCLPRRPRKRLVAFGLIASVVVGSALVGGGFGLIERLSAASHLDSYEAQQRMALWQVGMAIVVDYPLVGAGPATYPVLFDEYSNEVLDPYWVDVLSDYRAESPHNVYISIAAGSGLPALIAYLAFMLGVVRSAAACAVRAAPHEGWLHAGIAAAIVGHLTAATFMSAEVTSSWTLWVLAGLGASVISHGLCSDFSA